MATKLQDRIESVLVQEGDLVQEGQVPARIDATVRHLSFKRSPAMN